MSDQNSISQQTMSLESIIWAYRLFLGKETEQPDLINQYIGNYDSFESIRRHFSQLPEFKNFYDSGQKISKSYSFSTFLIHWLLQNDPEFPNMISPTLSNPTSQLCTCNQFKESIYSDWCAKLHYKPVLHRKQWEYIYILQSLKHCGVFYPGARGLGFGTGREPLPSCMAAAGISVIATDAPPNTAKEWSNSKQYTECLDTLFYEDVVEASLFKRFVRFEYADMNSIPDSYREVDFCWSSCCLEHLGSIEKGIKFIENSLKTLRPGGVAVHTTEFNLSSNDETLEEGETVLFRMRDMKRLAYRLTAAGYNIRPFNFFPGSDDIDAFIDLPPYNHSPHLKLQLSRFVTTSIGIIVQAPRPPIFSVNRAGNL